ncbi:LexA family transcriptional regulator [Candidatus Magnetaquicoccus inordinatus]|uniref:LexA family transcriptional regulator n=1 Tax=Candidatus Magnetaquicoccus inordinatus TaxID=2496818 RepID=UPI00102BEF18|nr:S24 family peptidase [Candidatus Magnetaquicoccus inordinatus]
MGNPEEHADWVAELRSRLAKVIGDEDPYPWAERIGIGKSTFAGLWRHGAGPQTKTLLKIAQHTNISLNWLLTGQGPERLDLSAANENGSVRKEYLTYVSATANADSTQEHYASRQPAAAPIEEIGEMYRLHGDEYCHVPCFVLPFANGQLLQSEQLVDSLSFKMDWLEHTMGLDVRELALVQVTGDSMEPTLKERDLLLVDRRGFTQTEQTPRLRSDSIYVLLRGSELVAKRLQFGFDGSLTIQSDNIAYAAHNITAEQLQQVQIIGRVVWVGRRV